MKFAVTAQSCNRASGQINGPLREEVVDTETNRIFTGLTTVLEVKEAYEGFWNYTNESSESVVFVHQVVGA